MDSTDSAQSAIDAIDTVAFKVGLKGYNVDEVDEFLERLSIEVRQLKDLAHQQRQQLRQAAERISQLDTRGDTTPVPVASRAPVATPIDTGGVVGAEQVTSMIAMAQRFIDQAQQEAESKALEITSAAQDRAREIVNEARSRAEDEVNRLNGLKQRLSEDVDTLAHQLQSERTRITQVLAEFTSWVENSLQAGGTKRPAAAAPATSASAAPSPAPTNVAPPPAPPRPTQTPPPAPPPTSPMPTIGQVLKFEQSPRDSRP